MSSTPSFIRSPAWNLALATIAFLACFSTWGLIAPLAKQFQDTLGLSSTTTLFMTAVPVILGSLLRMPMGMLTDRYGGRRVFALILAFSALPAVLFGYAQGYWQLVGVGLLLGVAGSSFAIGVPFVASWFAADRQGMGIIKDDVGTYTLGFAGLLAATGLCLTLAVWQMRSAVGVELRGAGAMRGKG